MNAYAQGLDACRVEACAHRLAKLRCRRRRRSPPAGSGVRGAGRRAQPRPRVALRPAACPRPPRGLRSVPRADPRADRTAPGPPPHRCRSLETPRRRQRRRAPGRVRARWRSTTLAPPRWGVARRSGRARAPSPSTRSGRSRSAPRCRSCGPPSRGGRSVPRPPRGGQADAYRCAGRSLPDRSGRAPRHAAIRKAAGAKPGWPP